MKKIATYLFLITFLFIDVKSAFPQNDTLIFHPVNNPVLNSYDIRKIAIAKDGKLWLSTDNGVASFNGYDVRFYGRGDGGRVKMLHKSISRCFFDAHNNLYVLIAGGGIFYLDAKTGFVETINMHIASEDSSKFFFVIPYTEMLVDTDYLWIGRTNMGFVGYNISTKETKAYRIYNKKNGYNSTVTSIKKDFRDNNILWLGTSNGIWRLNKKTNELTKNFHCAIAKDSVVADEDILKITIADSDTIWFTAGGRGVGCYSITTGNYTIYPYTKATSKDRSNGFDFSFFQRLNSCEFLIGTHYNLPGIFNTQTHQYIFNSKLSVSFPGLNINHAVADSSGNIWCIIFGQLYFASANNSSFSTVLLNDISPESKHINVFRNIIWDDKRKLYYAAFDNSDAVFVLNSSKKQIASIPIVIYGHNKSSIVETHVYDVALDAHDRLWSCGASLNVYDSALKKMAPARYLLHNAHYADAVFQNIIVKGNHLYLQPADFNSKVFYRINTTNFAADSFVIPESIIKQNPPRSDDSPKMDELLVDNSERYAYAGLNNSLVQINLATKNVRSVSTNGGHFDNLSSMFWYAVDDDAHIWVCTIHGIEIYDEASLELYKTIANDVDYYIDISNAGSKSVMCVLYSKGTALFDYRNNRQYHLSIANGMIQLLNTRIAYANNNIFIGGELNALQYISLSPFINQQPARVPYISGIQAMGNPLYTDTIAEYTRSISLPYNKNTISLTFSCTEFQQAAALRYRYKLKGIDDYWHFSGYDNNNVSYNNLSPGDYTFYVRVMNADDKWSEQYAALQIHILPAWWQTTWFEILSMAAAIIFVWLIALWRIKVVRRQEQQRSRHEKELLELEAKALRAQMNPHFIFNCMNSIKLLIQQKDEEKAINYLTTFSKLIRTIFQNSDKREITLYDEIETCRLYTQSESMRFANKFDCTFSVDETIDLKLLMVPALIVQPFIENAIWHGIMPKEEGGTVTVTVKKAEEYVCCIIDDDGIGRETSRLNKFKGDFSAHQSKGMHLTQTRIDLDNLLNERKVFLEIIDKKSEEGKPEGTTIIIKFKEY